MKWIQGLDSFLECETIRLPICPLPSMADESSLGKGGWGGSQSTGIEVGRGLS